MKKIIEAIVYLICGIILAWMFLCWVDVVLHNGMENPVYADWNLWLWLSKTGGN